MGGSPCSRRSEAVLRVVIAEDEFLVAAMLRRQVEVYGHEVIASVTSGDKAVEICRVERPDLVLMDVQMPRMDGIEATRALMAECPTCIVIVTGRAELEQAVEQAGAMGYATKPLFGYQIPSLVEAARRRFERFTAVREETNGRGNALQAWLLTRRAVSVLMNGTDTSEEQAFSALDRIAAEEVISLPEAAGRVLAARELVGV